MVSRNHVSQVSARGQRFLITDRPTEATLVDYVKILKDHNVKALVRVCEPSYPTDRLRAAEIEVHDWGFDDGDPPPDDTVDRWLQLCKQVFDSDPDAFIAVHCVAGLGRAPVMVAIALMESGMSAEEAVVFIRKNRHGAINKKQLLYLRQYRRRSKSGGGKCVIS